MNTNNTGIIRDKQGRKMSKSLGNSPDPLELIASYSADALRFGIMRSAPLGQDIAFDEKNVELGRNFCTKLWNACRFRQMQGGEVEGEINPALLSSDDKWILLRLNTAIHEVTTALEEYRFSDATSTLYRFFWSEYCDWYVEASKAVLQGTDDKRKANPGRNEDYTSNGHQFEITSHSASGKQHRCRADMHNRKHLPGSRPAKMRANAGCPTTTPQPTRWEDIGKHDAGPHPHHGSQT